MTSAALFCQARGLVAAGATDPGQRASRNEDCFAISHDAALCVVEVGAGGGALGGAAARVACEVVQERFDALATSAGGRGTCEDLWLADAVRRAHERIHATWPEGRTATTIVAAAFVQDRVIVAHVGDSRLYRLRGLTLSNLTADHTVAGRLTRALGIGADVDVELSTTASSPATASCSAATASTGCCPRPRSRPPS